MRSLYSIFAIIFAIMTTSCYNSSFIGGGGGGGGSSGNNSGTDNIKDSSFSFSEKSISFDTSSNVLELNKTYNHSFQITLAPEAVGVIKNVTVIPLISDLSESDDCSQILASRKCTVNLTFTPKENIDFSKQAFSIVFTTSSKTITKTIGFDSVVVSDSKGVAIVDGNNKLLSSYSFPLSNDAQVNNLTYTKDIIYVKNMSDSDYFQLSFTPNSSEVTIEKNNCPAEQGLAPRSTCSFRIGVKAQTEGNLTDQHSVTLSYSSTANKTTSTYPIKVTGQAINQLSLISGETNYGIIVSDGDYKDSSFTFKNVSTFSTNLDIDINAILSKLNKSSKILAFPLNSDLTTCSNLATSNTALLELPQPNSPLPANLQPISLKGGETCVIVLRLKPQDVAKDSIINSDIKIGYTYGSDATAGSGAYILSVTGFYYGDSVLGINPNIPNIPIPPGNDTLNLDLANPHSPITVSSTQPTSINIKLTNTSKDPSIKLFNFDFSKFPLPPQLSIENNECVSTKQILASNDICTFDLVITPAPDEIGIFNYTIPIEYSDGGSSPKIGTIYLSYSILPPPPPLAVDNDVPFGKFTYDAPTKTITIRNNGVNTLTLTQAIFTTDAGGTLPGAIETYLSFDSNSSTCPDLTSNKISLQGGDSCTYTLKYDTSQNRQQMTGSFVIIYQEDNVNYTGTLIIPIKIDLRTILAVP